MFGAFCVFFVCLFCVFFSFSPQLIHIFKMLLPHLCQVSDSWVSLLHCQSSLTFLPRLLLFPSYLQELAMSPATVLRGCLVASSYQCCPGWLPSEWQMIAVVWTGGKIGCMSRRRMYWFTFARALHPYRLHWAWSWTLGRSCCNFE